MAEVLALYDTDGQAESGYRGGKLEEVFIRLTQENT